MRISKQWRYVVSKQKTMVSGLLVMCLLLPSHEREGERVKGQSEEESRVGKLNLHSHLGTQECV